MLTDRVKNCWLIRIDYGHNLVKYVPPAKNFSIDRSVVCRQSFSGVARSLHLSVRLTAGPGYKFKARINQLDCPEKPIRVCRS